MGTSVTKLWFCRRWVTLKLEFTNDTDVAVDATGNETPDTHAKATPQEFKEKIDSWAAWILKRWNEPYDSATRQPVTEDAACGFELQVDAHLRSGPATKGFHQIRVVGSHEASWACIWPCCPTSPAASTESCTGGATPVHASAWPGASEWAFSDSGDIAAHECGHLMGLFDEYKAGGAPNVFACVPASPPPPHPAQQTGLTNCLMGCFAYPLAVFELHHLEILEVLKAKCWWWCGILKLLTVRLRIRPLIRYRLEGDPARPPPWVDKKTLIPLEPALEEVLARRDGYALIRGVRALADHTRREGPARLLEELTHESHLRRWVAALAAVADDGRETRAALQRRLSDDDVNVVVRAASTLGRHGARAEAVGALIEATRSEAALIGHPPGPVSGYALRTLERITGHDPGFDSSDPELPREKTAAYWEAWAEKRGEAEEGEGR